MIKSLVPDMNSPFSFVTAGQCLIKKDLRFVQDPGFQQIVGMIREADLAFANYENAILGNDYSWPTKTNYCSAVSADTLDGLKAMGFTSLSMANNHAFDLGPGGILQGLKEVQKRDFVYAGTGRDFTEASQPGFRDYPFGRVAVIAMYCAGENEANYSGALNANREKGIPARPGVNLLRGKIDSEGRPCFAQEDQQRHLDTIRQAAEQADFVLVYIHIHINPKLPVPDHYRTFARQCIDAGANILIGHGNPVFAGVEVYRNRPLFYNLSNLVFHSFNTELWHGRYGSEPWESVLTRIQFDTDGDMIDMELHPILLGNPTHLLQSDLEERKSSYPIPADPERGQAILQRLQTRSLELDTSLTLKHQIAHWTRES